MEGAPRFTRLSKALAGVLVLLALTTTVAPATRGYLALVPGRTIPCLWNLVTGGFTSSNLVEALFSVGALLLLARLVEPVYGSTELLRFILVVDVSACAMTFIMAFLVFIFAPQEHKGKTLYTQFCGFHGVVAGLLVALKQVMPDQDLTLARGMLRLRAKYFPSVFIAVAGSLMLIARAWSGLPLLVFGGYASWAYLRFVQQQPETAIRGDPSEDFKFSSFFPEAMAPPLDAVGGVLCTLLRLRPGSSGGGGAAAGGGGLLPTSGVSGLLGSNAADASRRRERGARALEQRLEMKRVGEAALAEPSATVAVGGLPLSTKLPAATLAAQEVV